MLIEGYQRIREHMNLYNGGREEAGSDNKDNQKH